MSSLAGTASRVTYLCPNDVHSVISQWSTWISGNIAVPLSSSHPPELLEYFIKDSQSNLVVTTPELEERIRPIAAKLNVPSISIDYKQLAGTNSVQADDESLTAGFLPGEFYKKSPAMVGSNLLLNSLVYNLNLKKQIVYTSGTTAAPKGVVLTHSNLDAQVTSLHSAWNITSSDTILHSLPLHHVHGLINALLMPLMVGGKVIMLPKFETERVWELLLNLNMPLKDRPTVYMGVPTIYNYLIQEYDKLFKKDSQMAEYIKVHCQNKIRLMISGSAPLPTTVFKRWNEITGHNLLERYGMTEIGMALSNTLKENQYKKRLPGFVGQPLPSVQIRIANPENGEVLLETQGEFNKGLWSNEDDEQSDTIRVRSADASEVVGDLLVKSPSVFKEYWNKPEATKKEFTADGWFKTGDSAAYDPALNSFKILGRNSSDILKSRGYKISALEMETKLLEHHSIEDCAVLGIPDETYGQKIVAIIKYRTPEDLQSSEQKEEVIKALNKWCQNKFASYSVPSVIEIVSSVPRNQMGKVNKADLVSDYVARQSEAHVK